MSLFIEDLNGNIIEVEPDTTVPASRNFRDAWVVDGAAIVVDMVEARKIFRAKVQEAEANLFATSLGQEALNAYLENDNAARVAARGKRDAVRMKRQDAAVDAAATPEELVALWDEAILGPSPFS